MEKRGKKWGIFLSKSDEYSALWYWAMHAEPRTIFFFTSLIFSVVLIISFRFGSFSLARARACFYLSFDITCFFCCDSIFCIRGSMLFFLFNSRNFLLSFLFTHRTIHAAIADSISHKRSRKKSNYEDLHNGTQHKLRVNGTKHTHTHTPTRSRTHAREKNHNRK